MLDCLFQFPKNTLKEKKRSWGEDHEVTEKLPIRSHVLPDHLATKNPSCWSVQLVQPMKVGRFWIKKAQCEFLPHRSKGNVSGMDPEMRISQTVQGTGMREATFPGNCFVRIQPAQRNIWGRKNFQTKHFKNTLFNSVSFYFFLKWIISFYSKVPLKLQYTYTFQGLFLIFRYQNWNKLVPHASD